VGAERDPLDARGGERVRGDPQVVRADRGAGALQGSTHVGIRPRVGRTPSGTTIAARLPGRDSVREVIVGVPESDGRVRVVHAFAVHTEADKTHLR